MKVLALVTDAFGGEYGIARFNRHFLSALTSMDGETSIVVLARTGKPHQETLPPRIQWKGVYDNKGCYALSALQAVLTEKNFDLIFCGHLHLAPLAAVLARFRRLPLWLQLYGDDAWEKPGNRPFLSWGVKQATIITAISRYTRRKFLAWAALDPERVTVLPCTVDPKFQPGPKPDYLLKRYGLGGKKVLFTVSRITLRDQCKGHERIFEIMSRLLERHPHLVYVIAGEGAGRPQLEKKAREYGLDGRVRFIGEAKESELVDHYRMADVFVMPSTGEGFGIVFLEAMACGVPTVGGNQDGSADALVEGTLGAAVNPHDPDEICHAILEALDSKSAGPKPSARFSNGNFCHLAGELLKERVCHAGNSK